MGKRHKHADVIIAWANGKDIEFSYQGSKWLDYSEECGMFNDNIDYRIKPKIVKREGWVARYNASFTSDILSKTEDQCRSDYPSASDYHRIEWEEEV